MPMERNSRDDEQGVAFPLGRRLHLGAADSSNVPSSPSVVIFRRCCLGPSRRGGTSSIVIWTGSAWTILRVNELGAARRRSRSLPGFISSRPRSWVSAARQPTRPPVSQQNSPRIPSGASRHTPPVRLTAQASLRSSSRRGHCEVPQGGAGSRISTSATSDVEIQKLHPSAAGKAAPSV